MIDARCKTQASSRDQAVARARVFGLVRRRVSLYLFMTLAIILMSFSEGVRAQWVTTLEEAADEVRAQHKGARILKAEPKTRSDGSRIFRFRLLTRDGMVKTIKIAPERGPTDTKPRRKNKKRQ